MKLKITHTLAGATLTWLLAISAANATYICTGESGPANSGDPYFNGDLTDVQNNCGEAQVNTALGIIIDQSKILGSKIDSDGDPISSWSETENDLGTLTVLSGYNDKSGTWELTGAIEPLFYVVKYDGAYDIYSYMGGSVSPFSDSWLGTDRGGDGASCDSGIKCQATVSHVSVYGEVPIPAAAWLFGSGLIGLAGIAKRRKS